MSAFGAVRFSPALFWAGVFNVATGVSWDTPMCVQPMKTIAAVTLASGDVASPGLSPEEVIGAGLAVSVIVTLLGATGGVDVVNRLVPRVVVRGLQLGLGVSMATSGLHIIAVLPVASALDSQVLGAVSALAVLVLSSAEALERVPAALVLCFLGMTAAAVQVALLGTGEGEGEGEDELFGPGFPPYLAVSDLALVDVWNGFLKAGLAQVPLTTLNSVIAVTELNNEQLFPDTPSKHVSRRAVAVSVGAMNVVSLPFGGLPMCHGSGGLAAQHRFGARSGNAVIMLGLAKVALAVLLDDGNTALLRRFPRSILGVLLAFSGLALALAGVALPQSSREDGKPDTASGPQPRSRAQDTVLMVTCVVTVALKTGWGFAAGMLVVAIQRLTRPCQKLEQPASNENLTEDDDASSSPGSPPAQIVPT